MGIIDKIFSFFHLHQQSQSTAPLETPVSAPTSQNTADTAPESSPINNSVNANNTTSTVDADPVQAADSSVTDSDDFSLDSSNWELSEQDEWMVREAEFQAQTNNQPHTLKLGTDAKPSFTLGFVLQNKLSLKPSSLLQASCVSRLEGNQPKVLNNPDELWNFDLLEHLQYSGADSSLQPFDARFFSLVLSCSSSFSDKPGSSTFFQVILFVRGMSQVAGSRFARISLYVPPFYHNMPPASAPVRSKRFDWVIACDEVDQAQLKAKFDYLKAEASDTLAKGNLSSLSPVQSAMLMVSQPNVIWQFFYAYELVQIKNFARAISLFQSVYLALKTKWQEDKTNEEEERVLFNSIYWLGICYQHLHLYTQAVYYLNMMSVTNNYSYLKAFINCLVASQDVRAAYVVATEKNRIESLKTNNDTLSEADEEYFYFLLYSEGHIFIYKNMLDQAQNIFVSLSKNKAWQTPALKALKAVAKKKAQNLSNS